MIVVTFERLRVHHQSEINQLQEVNFKSEEFFFADSADDRVVFVGESQVFIELHRQDDACKSQPMDRVRVHQDLRVHVCQPVDVNQRQDERRL